MPGVVSCLLPGSEFDRAAEGLFGAAQRLARSLESEHTAIVFSDESSLLESCSRNADRVVAITDSGLCEYQPEPCLSELHALCTALAPAAVLLGQDTYSQELTPRLAYRMQGCSLGDAQRIALVEGRVHVSRSVYGGKAMAVVQANCEPAVIWLRARAFAAEPTRDVPGVVEQRHAATDANAHRPTARIVSRRHETNSSVRLEDAQLIVSGGRGLGGPEPFEDLRELARVMNAELAASRAACDAGWVAPGLQVGQTGKKVAPELYLAIAISGASQHLMGIADAKVVAAINTDPDAPIFRRCQFGLVDDWKNVVGRLTEQMVKIQFVRGQKPRTDD